MRNVPSDALGYVVVNNLAATDAKVQQVLKTMRMELPPPLVLFQAATGLAEGVNRNGDMLFVALPAAAEGGKLQFAVWIPVENYERLVARLDAAPGQEITAATIADEDVLIARHGEWALVMDPEQRDRMEQTLGAELSPPRAAAGWNDWIDKQDLAAVLLPEGVRALLAWSADAQPQAVPQPDPAENAEIDDIFDFGQAADAIDPFAVAEDAAESAGVMQPVREAIARWTSSSPRLRQLFVQAQAIGCGVRLDESGNATANLRLADSPAQAQERQLAGATSRPPVSMYRGGSFVVYGAGSIPRPLTAIATETSLQSIIEQLKSEERMVLPDATVAQFQQTVQQAVAQVESLAVLTHPGDQADPVYTNEYLMVRTASAAKFAGNAREVMRLWNSMNRDAEGSTHLVFDVEDVKIGERAATQYLLDIAAADGAPELPEIRQAMEKLFGAGGKLQLWIVPVDDQTVLLARATPEQLTAALKSLDEKLPMDWTHAELRAANGLLPEESSWRMFVSPHHYNRWHRRQMEAITGPVIGGPLVKDFPAAPPIGIAGGETAGELWINVAVPVEVIRSAGAYWKN